MEQLLQFLKENPVQYFATIGKDQKPKVRPFQFMLEKEGKLYFCTSSQKPVFGELSQNPYVEISVASSDFHWLRLHGKAVFSSDAAIKAAIIESSPLVKSIYQTPNNPIFEIFYLEEAEAVLSDFSGKPPVKLL